MIISIKALEERKMENIVKEEMPEKKEENDFWTDEEKRLFADLKRIEKSNMLWPEKKFYSTLANDLYEKTNYYKNANSIGELYGWIKPSFTLKQD